MKKLLRIISGSAKGRNIQAPDGIATRPTLERVRESVFNIIQFVLEGAIVLDLFAGSGAMGLEALSRGARRVVFNDSQKLCARIIESNVHKLGFKEHAKVLTFDFLTAIARLRDDDPFDLVFVDPPYNKRLEQLAVNILLSSRIVRPGGRIIVEHAPQTQIATPPGVMHDTRIYGDTTVTILTLEERL